MPKLSVAIATLLVFFPLLTHADTQTHDMGNLPHTMMDEAQPHAAQPASPETATRYHANGIVKQWDSRNVTLSHEAIAALRWPAMTMTFRLPANRELSVLPQGSAVSFSFVQSADNYTLTDITPRQN
ncbi:copper-binding protein [Dickeya sp. DW 0440]|uniref:copper-binding protein n=1 Tax=Dickeya sp. DW 0440 TaxID=1225785 RepID=UPI0003AA83BE|nr:copper-binding protein [Dickeya sp. DW 0440]